jgi:hypothetical protein
MSTTRFTVDLGKEFDENLTRMAQEGDASKAEVIRRALIAYTALKNEVKKGNKVSITAQTDDTVKKDVILP